jgi:hypothetical protein
MLRITYRCFSTQPYNRSIFINKSYRPKVDNPLLPFLISLIEDRINRTKKTKEGRKENIKVLLS